MSSSLGVYLYVALNEIITLIKKVRTRLVGKGELKRCFACIIAKNRSSLLSTAEEELAKRIW